MAGDDDQQQNLTKEEKKRRKAEKKERKAEKKAAKKRKRDSVESAASSVGSPAPTNNGGAKKSKEDGSKAGQSNSGNSSTKNNRARTNSVASMHTHQSVTEDIITERIGANVPSRIVSGDATGSSSATAARPVGASGTNNGTGTRRNVEVLPYRLKKVRSLVSLAPSSLSDVKGNIRRLSCQDVTRYVQGLGGVLMAVRDVQVCGPGRVQNELAHVHYEVEADLVVFCPDVGTRLVGVVTESFPSHVGMLVDTLFNAMVPAEELRRLGYEYDMDSNQWSTERDVQTGERLPSPLPISIDDRIGFTVSKLNELNGIISLEGDNADMQGAQP
mmetsp:Transcript_26567/g.76729  ORF Transcript_26567/g.76729 Transcript_26567/m.76729 type:complete len:330 (-) Transcript_26567:38-1027(-)|eukprot:CAMPEP_0181059188 /NCGR_PEP_ID=MMETSP1070-20121207/21244_1 /TAXON_ID=265543 /ORGANISM="Minutocellus polymorphus, Strain NH13" /LENGTH=329 /DNA_ID=CAMNT_0023138839 /DNA_START=144 /DNA_END=1133 /DNA_ORIENTATION=+